MKKSEMIKAFWKKDAFTTDHNVTMQHEIDNVKNECKNFYKVRETKDCKCVSLTFKVLKIGQKEMVLFALNMLS